MALVITEDGSKTLYSEKFGEHYHSLFGAVNESQHIFIRAGLLAAAGLSTAPINVLEIGFGTGWNAFLTLQQAASLHRLVFYETLELFPVDFQTAQTICDDQSFLQLHTAEWNREVTVSPDFTLHKRQVDLLDARFSRLFDVIYFDAFSPKIQPEMWTFDIFNKLFAATQHNGILTTYCAKGAVRRTMQAAGFSMERLPGPKGKREMLRGSKTKTFFRTVACLLLALFCLLPVAGQTPSSASKKAVKSYNTALEQYQRRQYKEAIVNLNAAIKADNRFYEAYMLTAECYLDTEDLPKAKEAFLRCTALKPDAFPPVYYSLADICFEQEEYEEASRYLEKYLAYDRQKPALREKANKLLSSSRFAADAVAHPVPFQPENIGLDFGFDQYWPSLSVDEQTLIFTALIPKDAANPDVAGNRHEDFFVSDFQAEGTWTKPENLGSPPNTADNEGAQTITADASRMFFTACNRPDGKGGCDIYYSEKHDGLWTRPRNLGAPVNTAAKETQPSISADGRTLYFVSAKKGGKGGQDIWKSELNERNQWGEPVNLAELNTSGDESSPFIHFDNRTLYFASDGLPGMGNFDLFVSRKDSTGKWTKPVNLGYPINSKHNEEGLIVNARGDRAYYSSDRTEHNIRNIFTFELFPEMRPQSVSYMKGKIFDSKYFNPLKAKFELTDLSTGKKMVEAFSDSLKGEFLVCLPVGGQYALNIARTGYLFFSEHIVMKEGSYNEPYVQDFALRRVQAGEKIVLENIFFGFDSHQLLDASKTELIRIVTFMNSNPAVKIRITGHTDNTGKAAYNLELSQNRARAVAEYLRKEGIPTERVSYRGIGAAEPVADNTTEAGRAKNRRTEMEIVQ
ncbi:hypothetical protein FACS189430_10780 [Bacteroidia bacterium]|nr:hypothetical protein FACS189430_10780 [Bacteroidia bacterium]